MSRKVNDGIRSPSYTHRPITTIKRTLKHIAFNVVIIRCLHKLWFILSRQMRRK